jgi:hypothetical protein
LKIDILEEYAASIFRVEVIGSKFMVQRLGLGARNMANQKHVEGRVDKAWFWPIGNGEMGELRN